MRWLLLQMDAPLMSFGGVCVDGLHKTERFPGRSQITGMLASAMGIPRGDDRLDDLQDAILYGVRVDRRGQIIKDYHTVDLGQPLMRNHWTTDGFVEGRRGSVAEATHIREDEFLSDAALTVALTVTSPSFSLRDLETHLLRPVWPIYFGRRCCVPVGPTVVGQVRNAISPRQALQQAPAHPRSDAVRYLWTEVSRDANTLPPVVARVHDRKDWANQVHAGTATFWQRERL